ncbi:hypothetical protein C8Q74DRAFT_381621 [Fomes fomentarius]|nr:hypothetical protein C8Q74DRAFT_381621 [Fomes fomentarius]
MLPRPPSRTRSLHPYHPCHTHIISHLILSGAQRQNSSVSCRSTYALHSFVSKSTPMYLCSPQGQPLRLCTPLLHNSLVVRYVVGVACIYVFSSGLPTSHRDHRLVVLTVLCSLYCLFSSVRAGLYL